MLRFVSCAAAAARCGPPCNRRRRGSSRRAPRLRTRPRLPARATNESASNVDTNARPRSGVSIERSRFASPSEGGPRRARTRRCHRITSCETGSRPVEKTAWPSASQSMSKKWPRSTAFVDCVSSSGVSTGHTGRSKTGMELFDPRVAILGCEKGGFEKFAVGRSRGAPWPVSRSPSVSSGLTRSSTLGGAERKTSVPELLLEQRYRDVPAVACLVDAVARVAAPPFHRATSATGRCAWRRCSSSASGSSSSMHRAWPRR